MEVTFNETFGSCRPWGAERVMDNMNLLNNLKRNLCSYEKVYKKFSVKTRSELPDIHAKEQSHNNNNNRTVEKSSKKIILRSKNKTLESCNKLSKGREGFSNKSVELHYSGSESRLLHGREADALRGLTTLDTDKEHAKGVLTERGREGLRGKGREKESKEVRG